MNLSTRLLNDGQLLINDKSKKIDRELGTGIHVVNISDKKIDGKTDENGNVAILGQTIAGTAKKNGQYSLDLSIYLDGVSDLPGKLSALVHAHANGSDYFSGNYGDAGLSREFNIPIYLVTPRFQFRKFDVKTMNAMTNRGLKGALLNSELPIYRWDLTTGELSKTPDAPTTRADTRKRT